MDNQVRLMDACCQSAAASSPAAALSLSWSGRCSVLRMLYPARVWLASIRRKVAAALFFPDMMGGRDIKRDAKSSRLEWLAAIRVPEIVRAIGCRCWSSHGQGVS